MQNDFKKKGFFEFLNFNLKSTFLWLNQAQRAKKTSFSKMLKIQKIVCFLKSFMLFLY
jgi:hypothetical protein